MLKTVTNLVNVNQITGVLPVSNGGTGVSTSTGTGSTVLSAAPTLSGNVTLSTGNLIVSNGKGIDFSATPGTGTSELLSDYEEGTCTATLTCSTSGTITLNGSFNTLYYTKIGRLVTVQGLLVVSAISSPVGNLSLNGLPFTSNSAGGSRCAITVTANSLAATAVTSIVGAMDNSATSCFIYKYSAGALSALAGDVTSSSSFNVTISYLV